MDSDELAPYFDGINMERLMDHQTKFIAKALGGPDKYKGRDLKAVHQKFNITQPDFKEVAELLAEALEEAGVTEDDVGTIISVVASLQDQIVSA